MNLDKVKIRKAVLNLDKPRTLQYDLNAFSEVEDAYGSIDLLLDQINAGSIKAIRFLLWAGLIHEDESLTLKQVGALIDVANLDSIMESLTEAVDGALPDSVDVQEGQKTDPLVVQ